MVDGSFMWQVQLQLESFWRQECRSVRHLMAASDADGPDVIA